MFMSGVHLDEPDPRGRFYKWPAISVINKFKHVAVNVYIMKLQEAGKQPPASVIAINPSLWTHLKIA